MGWQRRLRGALFGAAVYTTAYAGVVPALGVLPPPDEDTPDAIREFTQRCTDVLEMYVRRHPSLLAQSALTIDHLARGRFVLGLPGLQHLVKVHRALPSRAGR